MLQLVQMVKKEKCKKLISFIKKIDKNSFPVSVMVLQDYRIMEVELTNLLLKLRMRQVFIKNWNNALEKECLQLIDKDVFYAFNKVHHCENTVLY